MHREEGVHLAAEAALVVVASAVAEELREEAEEAHSVDAEAQEAPLAAVGGAIERLAHVRAFNRR